MIKKESILRNYISSLQVDVTLAAYTHCWKEWKDINYTPDYNKFYFIIEGEGWLKIKDKEFYPLPGQLFLMPEGVVQSYSAINDNAFKKYWCHFTAKTGNINIFDKIQLPYYINVSDRLNLEVLFKDLIQCYESGNLVSSFRVKAILMEIIAYYIENAFDSDVNMLNTLDNEKLNCVINYIDEHLSENITVEQLAKILHFNPRYFIRFFKQHIGNTPIQYINRIRMEKAKSILKSTGMNVSDVADITGFNDLFHFSKVFKAHTGFTPTEFKKITSDR